MRKLRHKDSGADSLRGRRVGVALGGGGARGWAHIGVLRALEERGLDITCVAGTSIGALVGGVYASGQLDRLERLALSLDWRRVMYYFLEFSLPRSGLVDGQRIVETLEDHVSALTVDGLPMPYAAVATDIYSGQEVRLDGGNLVQAIRASIAIPGMFTPVERDGKVLADGGLSNPLPVNVVRDLGAEVVIAVDITAGNPPLEQAGNDDPFAGPDTPPEPDDDTGWLHERIASLKRKFDVSRLL